LQCFSEVVAFVIVMPVAIVPGKALTCEVVMKRMLLALLTCCVVVAGAAENEVPARPRVSFETTEGTIVLELDGRRAPITVGHFLALVEGGHYDGTIFHRVIPDFMIQGGGYTRDLKLKEIGDTIPNESGNGLTNLRGTIAMARLAEPHTANAQFFINVVDNSSLNPRPEGWGYAVFGYVVEGMDVVDNIVSAPTGPAGEFSKDVPVAAIVIEKATLKSGQ
jgi:cyclophilin family peptidyl-prolyl cis-trans isomerase